MHPVRRVSMRYWYTFNSLDDARRAVRWAYAYGLQWAFCYYDRSDEEIERDYHHANDLWHAFVLRDHPPESSLLLPLPKDDRHRTKRRPRQ